MSDERVRLLEEKVEHLEFKLDLMFHDSNINRILYEYNITKFQYTEIMNLMDQIRDKLNQNEKVSNVEYESKIYEITGNEGDYHFAEYIAKAFWEDDRWYEVFPALYGEFTKYKHIISEKDGN
ncbi:DUF1878 domain-containing protein [Virgibacillus salexigens]|uniref:DUF1878 domain-containing protein n=1 Tax=Virgibacillus kapii TaxID=1638645 RepID=A0ABQ2DEY4_9BACI|nr:DUF1878 domain-containing protein [Virgibacillus kapii]GGJ55479.1 hypothetical protein GCM10007111_17210 [Virgibacillus kapii]